MEKMFLSVAEYSKIMGQSDSMTRKQVKNDEIRHMRSGDRILIPHDEPQRIYDKAFGPGDAA